MRRGHVLAAAACVALAACADSAPGPLSYPISEIVSREALAEANPGREVLRPDGRFALPRGVGRVWIDVGAHDLETTRHSLTRFDDILLIAIEPLEEHWRAWPEHPNLIALPVAISEERGWLDFNVAADDASSSLLETVPGNRYEEYNRTVEVRAVPALRLADVIERIDPGLDLEYVKSDVQGLDLQVLRSAGESLRRATFVQAEVILDAFYEGEGSLAPATPEELTAYMEALGFRARPSAGAQAERGWTDIVFVNRARDGLFDRTRRWLRQLFSVVPTEPV